MRTKAPATLPLFRSDLQARLLGLVVASPDRWWVTRELRDETGASPAGLHRELRRLLDAGLLEREAVGRAHRYRVATGSPLYEPLRQLVERSMGVEWELRRRLAQVPGLEAAAIFGSWAAGKVGPASDIDVIAVGDLDYASLAAELREVEAEVGREVNVVTYRPERLREKARGGSGFLRAIAERPLKPLVGDVVEMMRS